MSPFRTTLAAIRVVAPRPTLWITAARQARAFAPREWWRRRPFLPIPDPQLLKFRATTQYGASDHPPTPADLVAWLQWCKSEDQRQRSS